MAVNGTSEQDTDQEQDRHFRSADDYVGDEKGKVILTISFPEDAIGLSPSFRPVEGILAMIANAGGLFGLGENDEVVARVGIEKDKDRAGEPNPRAGEPNGRISMVIHTAETLAASKQRGRSASMSPQQKAAYDGASKALKALFKGMSDAEAEVIAKRIEDGELDADAIVKMAQTA